MENRREFIKTGLMICLGAGGALFATKAYSFPSAAGARWGMIIDTTRCNGCQSCMLACKLQNNTVQNEFNTQIKDTEKGIWPDARISFKAKLCVHCSDPSCVKACKPGAAFIHESGLVLTDWSLCDGNGACIDACPFDARFHDSRFSDKTDKCDLCINRLAQGLSPACVENCSPKARIFGRFDKPEGEFGKYLKNIKKQAPEKLGKTSVLFYSMKKGGQE